MWNSFFIVFSTTCIIIALICEIIRRWAIEKYKFSLLDNATFVQFLSLVGFVIFALFACLTA